MKQSLYHYRAKVLSVYDGDTIRVDLDLGLGIHNTGHNGKYGRLLAVVWAENQDGWYNVNKRLVRQGLAVEYMKER